MADISPKTSAICRKLKAELQISVDKQPKLCYNTNCGTAKAPMQGKHPHRRFYFVKKGVRLMRRTKTLLMPIALIAACTALVGCNKTKNDANTLNIVCLNSGYGREWIDEAVEIWKSENLFSEMG